MNYPKALEDYLNANPHYTDELLKEQPNFSSRTTAYFQGRVNEDWVSLSGFLPETSATILDIGSGVAGIDLVLYHWFSEPSLTLIDKRERTNNGQLFNVLAIAREFLTANGVREDHLLIEDRCNVDVLAKTNPTYDFVVSLRALGFQFPYKEYRAFLRRHLAVNGTLILDLAIQDSFALSQLQTIGKDSEINSILPTEVTCTIEADLGKVEIISVHRNRIRIRAIRTKSLPEEPFTPHRKLKRQSNRKPIRV